MVSVQIHRYGDCVAMHLGKGQTVYITPKEAKEIAKQLNQCAKDISSAKFVNSQFVTYSKQLKDTGYNGCSYEYKR